MAETIAGRAGITGGNVNERIVQALMAILGATGCGASSKLLLGEPVRKELAVLVRVSKAASLADNAGGTEAIVDRVTNGLSERGIQNQIYAADDDHPKAPRIEIWVRSWNINGGGAVEGATLGLGVAGQIATAGGYNVVARVYRDGAAKPCEFEYSGTSFSNSDTASADKGDSVGGSILSDAFGDPSSCKPPSNGNPPEGFAKASK